MNEELRKALVPIAKLIAELVADELREEKEKPPVTVTEFYEAIGRKLSRQTIYDRIKAGRIPTIEGTGKTLIPASFLREFNK